MISLIAIFVIGIVLQALTLDWARARVDENPEKSEKYANGSWSRLRMQQWFPRTVSEDLTAKQIGRMLRNAWAISGAVLVVTVLADLALWGWESRLASSMGWG